MQVSDNKNANVGEALKSFREDDKVKAVILSIDSAKRKISFGIKPSYFGEEDFEMNEAEEEESADEGQGEEQEASGNEAASEEDEEGSDDEVDSEMDPEDAITEASMPLSRLYWANMFSTRLLCQMSPPPGPNQQ
jgi:rRNA biogenesis protein RRP5